jgi:hypothetical protein
VTVDATQPLPPLLLLPTQASCGQRTRSPGSSEVPVIGEDPQSAPAAHHQLEMRAAMQLVHV